MKATFGTKSTENSLILGTVDARRNNSPSSKLCMNAAGGVVVLAVRKEGAMMVVQSVARLVMIVGETTGLRENMRRSF
jgi:hypothetical protein